MGLYNRFCKRFFAAVIIRLTAQSDSRAQGIDSIQPRSPYCCNSPCVCVCVFSSHSFWTSSSLDVPAGVTQEEGHTGFFIRLLPAVRALTFLARRIQPFLSLVDREVEFCVLTISSFSTRFFFFFFFFFFCEKNPVCRGRTHVPTCQRVTRYL